ncbi:iron-sulfur cluster repair protein YtfE [Sodalis sp. dw_96]|uniref:iron-sulfur cluster repair protein YtfE n=1 Tax=Sodalis sp. dw_96 TaxID=2719794 RepID=UPI001BD3E073|nr:iron-sulfur cluster repair protein YtfE [Sodalis sp. dw_96]
MHYRDKSLGSLAIAIPRATGLFRQYGLDFCCGGKQTLLRAADKQNLDIELIEAQLATLVRQPDETKSWQNSTLAELIENILARYHQRHREQLPELILMAEKVERVHQDKPTCPTGLARQLTILHQDLGDHMMKEEQVLFPMIKQGMGPQAAGPISVMELEHDDAGRQLDIISKLTDNITPPAMACTTWRALYAGLNEFTADLMEHVHLENNLLFPRALRGE